ncbi:MAG: hypothetical protein ACFN40_00010 [Bacteroidota bacterium]
MSEALWAYWQRDGFVWIQDRFIFFYAILTQLFGGVIGSLYFCLEIQSQLTNIITIKKI